MKSVVLDSYALLVYFERQPGWEEVAGCLAEAVAERRRLFLSVINWGEVCYITRREYGESFLNDIVRAIDTLPVQIVDIGRPLAAEAARLNAGGGLSYADCFAAALAMQEGGELMTSDPEFKRVEHLVPVRWLPRR